MAVAVHNDDRKEKARRVAWAALFGAPSEIYSGTNSGPASGSPVTTVVTAVTTLTNAWDTRISDGYVVYTGYVTKNTATLGVGSGPVATGTGKLTKNSDYGPETTALLDRLIATPLDNNAPAGEQEFLDWLNGS